MTTSTRRPDRCYLLTRCHPRSTIHHMMKNAVDGARPRRRARRRRGAARDLDFDVASGGVTGLLGPTGCGKTTLMRALVGVQQVGSAARSRSSASPPGSPAAARPGRLRHPGRQRVRRPHRRREPALLRPGARRRPRRGRRRHRRGRPRRPPDQVVGSLSGGQRSRVSLAVALLGEPRRAGARRADGRPRPGAAPRPVGALPPARRRRAAPCSSPAT